MTISINDKFPTQEIRVLVDGEIKNINMSPMTMPFSVESKSLMQDLVKGDHVLFYVENVDGELIIKEMVKSKK